MEHNIKVETFESEEICDKPCKQLLACLMYAMIKSRPDLNAQVSFLTRFQDRLCRELWTYLKRVLRYVKGTLK